MSKTVLQLYRLVNEQMEYCFNIECSSSLTGEELRQTRLLLADGFIESTITAQSHLSGIRVIEVGPRLNFATAWSSNMVSICQATGLQSITRVERSRRYVVADGEDIETFVQANHDRMTECLYPEPLASFETGVVPEPVYEVPLKEQGPDALLAIPGISMDEWDRNFYYEYFVTKHQRNPSIVEIMDLNNANSEHSRHGFFRGDQVIDGVAQSENLMDIVKSTLLANPDNSVIAFKDNSSAIVGRICQVMAPVTPGEPSPLTVRQVTNHILFTAETHNFPTGVAPFPGAETGTGGRIRDVQGTGRGGYIGAGTAAYCVANLHIPGYDMTWEERYPCPGNLASALDIEIEASNGASDYGNKFGEPLIQGFTRSFDLRLDNGERWGFLKPIMFTGGIGQIDQRHIEKKEAKIGMHIIQVGGPAYRVGFGGGAASSMLQGDNVADLDFNAVQRGDAEMEQKMNRVIRACNEMGDSTLIDVIHDQGAGGPGNVLKELVEKSGGRIGIRKIKAGDPTMSVLELYVAEYQERNGFLISPENLTAFLAICEREKVNCEVLGEVTGDLRFVVYDEADGTTPVDLELHEVLGNIPTKTFTDTRSVASLAQVVLPEGLTVRAALSNVLRLLAVGSKRFLTNKVDRSVTGLIAQQQCCGPLQATVSDVAVIAQSYQGLTGGACAIGEQPIKMIADPAAGARMAVGEAVTNLLWAKIDGLNQVKCSGNWMWAPKLSGEGAALYDAACAMRDCMISLGVAVDGGKDSLSMATRVGEETVKSPRELVISVYAAMDDITKVATPDLKRPGRSVLFFIDLGGGKNRLGGSALAQTIKQVGASPADLDDPALLSRAFVVIQNLLEKGLILAGHDRSDGGLITTVLEMAFAGNCGLDITLQGPDSSLAACFSEELGLVFEVDAEDQGQVASELAESGVQAEVVGITTAGTGIRVRYNDQVVLDEDMRVLRAMWEETSFQLERLQMNPACAEEERATIYDRQGPSYTVPFTPSPTAPDILARSAKPKVAILRDEGSNSDREMSAAFYAAGFEPWDITMTDLLAGKTTLDSFRGLAAVGGFSYADVPESAKGWAATIRFNQKLADMFQAFYNRQDTFSLGICNGCQLFGLLGWVPWQGIDPAVQPRFIRNISGRFESRWSTVKVLPSPAIMLKGMEGLTFGIHVAHGEGFLDFPDQGIFRQVLDQGLTALAYVDDLGEPTTAYPFNPNGSLYGLTGLCTPDGRHLAMMPHPERTFLTWQAHWLPEEMKQNLAASPWLTMFQNAYAWCTG
ncbi:MAG: phosphoribosylformylglycinamidine synthase [Proteobacteria bacterium]|nr:phosphoribosylformylglycinamidine synthase [Desulfobulbaceae bacterium]MBU4154235.1 phosphoribosylformylglycinamidine synthase [Pseudomonadota bacterium]